MDSQPAIPGQLSMAPRSDSDKMVSAATQIFKEAAMKPSQSIPAPVIKNAAGIAIFPGRARVTQAKGGTYRSGVMLSRRNNGKWSSPVFVSLAGNNIQSKPGSTSRDVVLIFNNRNALNRAAKGNGFTLGVDATLAQGYIGAKAPAAGTAAQVLAYQRTNGRFSGASLKGSALNIEPNRTIAYYNLTEGTAGAHGYYRSSSEGVYNKIIGSSDSAERIERHPANADHLRQALRDYVSQAHSSM
jgi:lipid-binding SYLF domain-containing protein